MNQTSSEVILGDSLDTMKRIESASVDLVSLTHHFSQTGIILQVPPTKLKNSALATFGMT